MLPAMVGSMNEKVVDIIIFSELALLIASSLFVCTSPAILLVQNPPLLIICPSNNYYGSKASRSKLVLMAKTQ